MPISEARGYCPSCKRHVLARGATANHLVHALVTLFLCGLWIPVWAIATLSHGDYLCPKCGTVTDSDRVAVSPAMTITSMLLFAMLWIMVAIFVYVKFIR